MPSLRAVFAKTAWQSKKPLKAYLLWRLKAPSLAEGVRGWVLKLITQLSSVLVCRSWGGENSTLFLCTKFLSYFYYKPKILWIFRLFLQKAQNDKILVILINFRHTDKALVILTCFVILSEAKYP